MKNFTAGASRWANNDARANGLESANDLVQRTLAQHGLVPGQKAVSGGSLPSMNALMARLVPQGGNLSPQAAPVPEGAEFRQGIHTGKAGSRNYRTYVPASIKGGARGIVVMLHGCTQNPEDFAAGTGMNALAEKHRLIVIYPEQSRGDNAQSCWNWFSLGDQRRDRGEPEILVGITRKAMAEHSVSPDRTFVAGLSAGAAMAVILGETYPDVFAAVGAHSGLPFGAAKDVPSAFAAMSGTAQEGPRRASTAAVTRTIIFHGTADATVHPSNGDRIARDAMDRGPRQTIQQDDQGSAGGRSFNRKITVAPDGTTALEHWTIDGLGHAWSGGQPAGSYTDAKGPDASAEMIRFFFNDADKET